MANAYKLKTAHLKRIEEVLQQRDKLEAHIREVPTDTQLGAELGVSARTISYHMTRLRRRRNPEAA